MARRKRLLLSGYFGFGNCGDEIIRDVEKNFFQEIGFEVFYISKTCSSEKCVSRGFLRTLLAILKSDIVISGGGGLLQDKTSVKSLLYYLSVLFLARISGKKAVCFAQGIGPVSTRAGKFLIRHLLSNADLITVRDYYSLEVLKNCGVSRDIEVCADVAFLYEKIEKIVLPYGKYVLFSPGCALKTPSVKVLSNIAKIIAEKSTLPVVIMPLYPERDLHIAKKVSEITGFPLITPKNPAQCAYVIKNSEFVVGMRYHSSLLSALYGKAFFPMAYDPKVKALSEEFGVQFAPNYGEITEQQFEEIFSESFENRREIEKMILSKLPGLKKRAEKNFFLFYEKFVP